MVRARESEDFQKRIIFKANKFDGGAEVRRKKKKTVSVVVEEQRGWCGSISLV